VAVGQRQPQFGRSVARVEHDGKVV
jgi:hypothetical protein